MIKTSLRFQVATKAASLHFSKANSTLTPAPKETSQSVRTSKIQQLKLSKTNLPVQELEEGVHNQDFIIN